MTAVDCTPSAFKLVVGRVEVVEVAEFVEVSAVGRGAFTTLYETAVATRSSTKALITT
jgi:hypothetical protein